MNIDTLRRDLWHTLNEDPTDPAHWSSDHLDTAIRLALMTVVGLHDTGYQRQSTVISTGRSEVRVPDAVRIVRIDRVGDDCDVRPKTMAQAYADHGCWRDCEATIGREAEFYVMDPATPDALWLIPPAPAGTEIVVTHVYAPEVTDEIPDHLYPAVFDLSMARALGRETGSHTENSARWSQQGVGYLADYNQVHRR